MNLQQNAKLPLILKAIPIQMDLKRYYWRKYLYLRKHNGAKYAADVFKTLRQTVMRYVDDTDRKANFEVHFNGCPVRKNGWLKKLFAYADTDPFSVIQFLKLYTVESTPVVSVSEAAAGMAAELGSAQRTDTPAVLYEWFRFIRDQRRTESCIRRFYSEGRVPVRDSLMRGFIQSLDRSGCKQQDVVRRYRVYRKRMLSILHPTKPTQKKAGDMVLHHLPTYASYKKFWDDSGRLMIPRELCGASPLVSGEDPLFTDACVLGVLSETTWAPEVEHIVSRLPEALQESFGFVEAGEDTPPVGHIRYIPKSGTVVRRSIADPNRFLQAGLVPYQRILRGVSSRIPRNCQFQQDKLDRLIYRRLQAGYAGSVDLHQATDWLPLEWFLAIEREFFNSPLGWVLLQQPFESARQTPEICCASRNLFMRISRAQWDSDGDALAWQRGQPLGTLPSFEVLTITHFVVMEALSCSCGLMWSPYALLGDDVVIFDPNVRRSYIDLMQKAGSPLSLHKSYEGRLTEFAGKLHIRNQGYRYSSDISTITWGSLFDLQRSMGVSVSYGDLPSKIKKKLERYAHACQQTCNAEDLYAAMQTVSGVAMRVPYSDGIGRLVENFYGNSPNDGPFELPRLAFMNFDGHVGAYDHEVALPRTRPKAEWWKKKNRPMTTDDIAKRCTNGRMRAFVQGQ